MAKTKTEKDNVGESLKYDDIKETKLVCFVKKKCLEHLFLYEMSEKVLLKLWPILPFWIFAHFFGEFFVLE